MALILEALQGANPVCNPPRVGLRRAGVLLCGVLCSFCSVGYSAARDSGSRESI